MNFEKRLHHLAEILEEDSVDALLIEDPLDIFYLTGYELSLGKLLVTTSGNYLIVDGRYFESCENFKFGKTLLLKPEILRDLLLDDLNQVRSFAFIGEKTTYQRYVSLKEIISTVHADTPERELELISADDLVLELRSIKESKELQLLIEAAELGCQGFDYILSLLREGVTEQELAQEVAIFWLRHGAQGTAFDPIVAFGLNSSKPHSHPGHQKLEKGMPVLIDIGVKINHYHSDMTRVVFFGEPEEKMVEIYEIVKEAQAAALKLCKPGTRVGDLDMEARFHISDKGYAKNFSHSLGHGIGLEVHELPMIRSGGAGDSLVLQPGMVLTIEPGIYLPGIGGVRIEDTVIITPEGHRNLTNRSKELRVI